MADRSAPPIIIKRIEDDADHGHHGGGWKVAYADFMTAMMAFFLLLWILAASDEEKLRGLADYFTPAISDAGGRGHGLLDGMVLGAEGTLSGTDGPQSEVQLPSFGQENPLAVFDSRLRDEAPHVVVEYATVPDGTPVDEALKQAGHGAAEPGAGAASAATAEAVDPQQAEAGPADGGQPDAARVQLDTAADRIGMAIRNHEELRDLTDNVRLRQTPEGLLVEVLDAESRSMFASGSARIDGETRELVQIIGAAIADLPQSIVISGHTDNVPFSNAAAGYGNWELSADRANATRRILLDTGVTPARIARISGLADTRPLDAAHPGAPQNRRISILVQYPETPQAPAGQGGGSPTAPAPNPD
ncbi:chemotaxis protein MotB [Mesobaculum littorinae]|uniref:Chemotaxis protein MotB n=1 Tax=Mesobaculum littorinae TaxID=2486419 RepID=A0A438ADT4_9RHOB|nr:flagellar motor protein MotB [Mesobaculum littorinae]RVV96854.1 chemotaxis protein MotB [Mesobaculum littorinae]